MLSFNNKVEDIVHFRALGLLHHFEVEKRQSKTLIVGDGWREFITHNHLIDCEMLCFSLRGGSMRISLFYIGCGEEDGREEYHLTSTIITQRFNLANKEKRRLLGFPASCHFLSACHLPLGIFQTPTLSRKLWHVCEPFSSFLHAFLLPIFIYIWQHLYEFPKMFDSMSPICDQGFGGVRLGFKRESDGRLSFTKES
jgi:hypothetical protein